MFEDIINYADELRDIEFENTISDINKFIARRSSQNEAIVNAASNIQATAAQPVETVASPVQPTQPVQPVQYVQPVQQVVSQTQVQSVAVQSQPQPVMQPAVKTITTDELYEQINDDFDDGIEEL